MNDELEKWIASRPPYMQEIIRKYPPDGKYRMGDDAPYLMTGPGAIVEILAYSENGDVRVAVTKDSLTPEGIEGMKMRLLQNAPHRLPELDSMIERGIMAHVNPKYLIPLLGGGI